ncbi:hypothetical protein [Streptomyces brevispora]|uniref:hypothetical protein n=1 Tax=Streptomyces brevispora TaxID=887462 RepID=UPI0039A67241
MGGDVRVVEPVGSIRSCLERAYVEEAAGMMPSELFETDMAPAMRGVLQDERICGEFAVSQGAADLGGDDFFEGQHEVVGRGGLRLTDGSCTNAWGYVADDSRPDAWDVEAPEGSPRAYETMCEPIRKDLS